MLSCDLLIFGMIWSFCNQFARWLQKIVACYDVSDTVANKKSCAFGPSKCSEKVDNAKITTYATISGRNNTKWSLVCLVWYLFVNSKTQIDASVVSLRYLLFTTLLIQIVLVFYPRAESATFLFATMDVTQLSQLTTRVQAPGVNQPHSTCSSSQCS
jgi:hypothetical protein